MLRNFLFDTKSNKSTFYEMVYFSTYLLDCIIRFSIVLGVSYFHFTAIKYIITCMSTNIYTILLKYTYYYFYYNSFFMIIRLLITYSLRFLYFSTGSQIIFMYYYYHWNNVFGFLVIPNIKRKILNIHFLNFY